MRDSNLEKSLIETSGSSTHANSDIVYLAKVQVPINLMNYMKADGRRANSTPELTLGST
jgi:hypothetical protein